MNPYVKAIVDGYTQEQRDLIAAAAKKAVSCKGCDYSMTADIQQYRNAPQWFANFGGIARDVTAFKREAEVIKYEYLPAFTETGEAIEEAPDEGQCGVWCE